MAVTGYATSDYAYELPKELIAQDPLEDRSSSRLLLMHRDTGGIEHHIFRELDNLLRPGDCLVFNDTRVIPARLLGLKKDTGAAVEILLLKHREDATAGSGGTVHTGLWECLVRPGKKLKPGAEVVFGGEPDQPVMTAVIADVLEDGNRLVRFTFSGIWEEVLDSLGEMPLPPYITHKLARENRDRYQTVYAKYEGSAAAPTAGLHFTKELLDRLEQRGVETVYVTLHVGLGTFRPVKSEDVREHHMHTEYCTIGAAQAAAINRAKSEGRRVICVGTTSVRTLESFAKTDGTVEAGQKETDIFIYPPYRFRVVDGLITNFHLPESTLLMLVSAFAGREQVLRAYEEAVRERYRFFSFGDAMFII